MKIREYKKINVSLLFLLLTVLLCSLAETALLEVKYKMFSGGFLQSNQLESLAERLLFIMAMLASNLVLYGSSFFIWGYLCRKFNVKVHSSLIYFHFMMAAGIVTASVFVVQFQLHKYFADAMDLALMKNIAGGDIKNALMYVFDELFLFFAGLFILVLIYFFLSKIAKKFIIKHDYAVKPVTPNYLNRSNQFRITGHTIAGVLLGLMAMWFINNDDKLRYNLNRVNSYSVITSSLDYISDVDRDGYGSVKHPLDVDAFNSTIYPGALDIPNNDIDEDGFFGDFNNYTPAVDYEYLGEIPKKTKHIFIIIMESARADLIAKKIDGQLVAPNINHLAIKGQFIEEAYSHTGYTASSLAAFFSGRIGNFTTDKSIYSILKQHGYRIGVFSGQDESWGALDIRLGTRKLADYFYDAQTGVNKRVFPSKLPSSIKLSEETLWQQFREYSSDVDWREPQFIYVNMQAGHFPYFHPKMKKNFINEGIPRSEIRLENKHWLEKTYWNALSHADFYIGKIIEELKARGVWENTLLIISGDHGEELFDDKHLGHGFLLSDVQTRIPLVISQADFKVTEPVGHSDMKKNILSYIFNDLRSTDAVSESQPRVVFQFIGSLDNPSKISFRYSNNRQIVLDFRNMLVRRTGKQEWISYKTAMNQAETKAEIKKLINHWENIRWQSHSVTKLIK